MTAQSDQESQYITNLRAASTTVLEATDASLGLDKQWSIVGVRLTEGSFQGDNAGLTPDDALHTIATLAELNTWLDTANRRLYLETLRVIS